MVIIPEPTFTEHPDTVQISPIAEIAIRQDQTDLAAAIQSVKRRS